MITVLYLGGWRGPLLPGPVWFFLKTFALISAFIWARAILPRYRYDQLMDLGWKVLIPLAFAWFLLITALRLADDVGWNRFAVAAISLAIAAAGYGLLALAFRSSARRRAVEGAIF
jgi:NADH-quinone oxidoreductase subunit H